jgi:hypothetical protein
MNKKSGWVIGALVIVLLAAGVYGTTTVFADEDTPPAPSGQRRPDGPGGPRGGRGLDGAALEAVAGVLDMSMDELSAALEGGKTLQELAEAAGVDMQQVFDAMQSARETSMRDRIKQGLADGTLTQDHADWLLEGLEKGYLDGPGFGFGGHPGKGVPPAPSE